MIICFTGHRDKVTDPAELYAIANQYPGAIWMHGGARGFDSQVDAYARDHCIQVEVVRPNYSMDDYRYAPLVRNRKMVDAADLVIACYDGRKTGGTWFTINYARRMKKDVVVVVCKTLARA